MSSYLSSYKDAPEVLQFLKKYNRCRRIALLKEAGAFSLLIAGSGTIWLPLSLLFGVPIYHVFVKPVADFLLNAPFSIPVVGAVVGAFLTYGGLATLHGWKADGWKKKDGTQVKPHVKAITTIVTAACILYTVLCCVNSVRSCNRGWTPLREKCTEAAKPNPHAHSLPVQYRTLGLKDFPVEKKARPVLCSNNNELYRCAVKLTVRRMSHRSFLARQPIRNFKMNKACV